MKLKEIALEWLEYKKKFVKLSTYAYYKTIVDNHIIPSLGEIDIQYFTEESIQETVLQWQSGAAGNQELKVSTIKNMIMILKQCMKYAKKNQYTSLTDFSIHYAVAEHLPSKKVFDIPAQKQLIRAALSDFSTKTLGIIISISCGTRIGELCALQWKDINFESRTLKISKTLQRVYLPEDNVRTRIVISTPKTVNSIREIPLPQNIIDLIANIPITDQEFYVLTNSKDYTEPRTYRKFFQKFLEKHEIETLNFHSLRHTFATRCIEKGADVKSVSDILGHSTISTTLNMYVHPGMEEKRKCVELLEWEN